MAPRKTQTLTDSQKIALDLFNDALPFYFSTYDELPDELKFRLMINQYGSAAMACVDIALHQLPGKACKECKKRLTHTQTWRGIEPEE